MQSIEVKCDDSTIYLTPRVQANLHFCKIIFRGLGLKEEQIKPHDKTSSHRTVGSTATLTHTSFMPSTEFADDDGMR